MNLREIKRMQYLAGIISENNMDPLDTIGPGEDEDAGEITAHDIDMNAIESMPEIDVAAELIMQNPHALEQLDRFAGMAGVGSELNEDTGERIDLEDVQRLADAIDGMFDGDLNEDADSIDVDEKKVDPMMTGASIGSVLPFIPGISGLVASASAATGIPMIVMGAGSVIAGAVVGAIIKKILDKRREQH